MKFLLQTNNGEIDSTEVFQVKQLCCDEKLNRMKTHEFEKTDLEFSAHHADFIPIGSLEFVGKWLKTFRNIDTMNPIEVPKVLRKPEFLLREYTIVPKEELDRSGRYFFKYAEQLKIGFCGTGTLDEIESLTPLEDGLYVQSGILRNILAEYRIIVLNDQIVAVRHYDGHPCAIFDHIAVQQMVRRYMLDPCRPLAYTLDVAVTEKGTAILEVHPFVSVGTYGFYSSDLPSLYYRGLRYYIDMNTPVQPGI